MSGAMPYGIVGTLRRLWQGPRERPALDVLLAAADPRAPFEVRVEWLRRLFGWVRIHTPPRGAGADDTAADAGGEPDETPGVVAVPLARDALRVRAARVRFLLRVLDRQPEWKSAVARTLRSILRDGDGVRLFGATGLPQEYAFWSEVRHRLAARVAPTVARGNDLAAALLAVLSDPDDALLLEALDAPTLAALRLLFRHDESPDEVCWAVLRHDLDDAVVALGSRIAAIGVAEAVRLRVPPGSLKSSPLVRLRPAAEAVFARLPAADDAAALADALAAYRHEHDGCHRALDEVMAHLEENGVSVGLVYQVELARWQLHRVDRLVELGTRGATTPGAYARFAAALVREVHARTSVGALFRENLTLLTRKISERTGRTGEHYITHDRAEYADMLRSAAKGGALTGFTVFGKFLTAGHGLAPFFEGVVAALNYACSFCLIQFTHGTLATKQPAMTAAAMAAKLREARHRRRLREFVDEVANLTRSQTAAIAGNLVVVAPAALVIGGLWSVVGGAPVPSAAKAEATLRSLSLLGPTPLFAAFTGVLLWLSAVISGWVENWATFRRIPDAIARHPRLVYAFGGDCAARMGAWMERNIAGLGGNVALGVLLGMTPVVAGFFGLPLDVRHVTLSTGSLALAVSTLGTATLLTAGFWLAVAGIAVIGALNLGVSFALALWVAIRATDSRALSRRRVYRAVFARFLSAPRDFLLPPRGH